MDPRGISTVIGGILMIAIVVILASVLATMALGFSEELVEPSPQVSLEVTNYHPDGEDNGGRPYFVIRHQAGDIAEGTKVFIHDDDGDRVAWEDVWSTGPKVGPGSHAHIDGCGSDGAIDRITEKGQVYKIVFESSEGHTLIVQEITVPGPPDPKPC